MLFLEDIKIELKCQRFEAKEIAFSPNADSIIGIDRGNEYSFYF